MGRKRRPTPVPVPLDLTGPQSLSVVEGTPITIAPNVTGGTAPVRFTLRGALPPGFVFDPATGKITGVA